MQIIIYGKELKQADWPYVAQVLIGAKQFFKKIEINAPYYASCLEAGIKEIEYCEPIEESAVAHSNAKFIITLGGDGTILSAIQLLGQRPVPILGINLGRMGFLAITEKSKINEAFKKLAGGQYRIDKRSMLQIETDRQLFAPFPHALNDMSIAKRENSSMISIQMYLNDNYFSTYWADGLIVSTPTGSTGYNLSCGGPIVYPSCDSFVVTPIAPHSLTVRAMVIPDRCVLRFVVRGRSDSFLCTVDSRFDTINSHDEIIIRKSDKLTHLVLLEDMSFGTTIREKLNWGRDLRN